MAYLCPKTVANAKEARVRPGVPRLIRDGTWSQKGYPEGVGRASTGLAATAACTDEQHAERKRGKR